MELKGFTIRVYGILLYDNKTLLSKEIIQGEPYTKFPGGGLELGEGIIDCLHREFEEELRLKIHSPRHFYTTEDFIASAFHSPPKQVLSIYYTVKAREDQRFRELLSRESFPGEEEDQILYWCPIHKLNYQPIHLPIDKLVVNRLTEYLRQ